MILEKNKFHDHLHNVFLVFFMEKLNTIYFFSCLTD